MAAPEDDRIDVDINIVNGMKQQQILFPGSLIISLATALPIPGSCLVSARMGNKSHWGTTAKLTVKLLDETLQDYFLKV